MGILSPNRFAQSMRRMRLETLHHQLGLYEDFHKLP